MPNTPTPTARLADDAPMLGGQSPITGREPMLGGERTIPRPWWWGWDKRLGELKAHPPSYLEQLLYSGLSHRERNRLLYGSWEYGVDLSTEATRPENVSTKRRFIDILESDL